MPAYPGHMPNAMALKAPGNTAVPVKELGCMVYVPQDQSFPNEEVGLLWGSNINQHSRGFGRSFCKAGTLTAHMDELNLTQVWILLQQGAPGHLLVAAVQGIQADRPD